MAAPEITPFPSPPVGDRKSQEMGMQPKSEEEEEGEFRKFRLSLSKLEEKGEGGDCRLCSLNWGGREEGGEAAEAGFKGSEVGG